jgi:hypothetical protein
MHTKDLASLQRGVRSIETAEPRARLSYGERSASLALENARKQPRNLLALIDSMECHLDATVFLPEGDGTSV